MDFLTQSDLVPQPDKGKVNKFFQWQKINTLLLLVSHYEDMSFHSIHAQYLNRISISISITRCIISTFFILLFFCCVVIYTVQRDISSTHFKRCSFFTLPWLLSGLNYTVISLLRIRGCFCLFFSLWWRFFSTVIKLIISWRVKNSLQSENRKHTSQTSLLERCNKKLLSNIVPYNVIKKISNRSQPLTKCIMSFD